MTPFPSVPHESLPSDTRLWEAEDGIRFRLTVEPLPATGPHPDRDRRVLMFTEVGGSRRSYWTTVPAGWLLERAGEAELAALYRWITA